MYRLLMSVPAGRVTTYSDLARAAGAPGAQRAVGTMMRDNPHPGVVPCHRVVRSDGAVGGYAFGPGPKEAMLAREGVKVEAGRVDLESAKHRF